MSLLGPGGSRIKFPASGRRKRVRPWFVVMYSPKDGEHVGWSVSGCDAGRWST